MVSNCWVNKTDMMWSVREKDDQEKEKRYKSCIVLTSRFFSEEMCTCIGFYFKIFYVKIPFLCLYPEKKALVTASKLAN